jgi:DNA-binding XRE family transcriptional regulator
MARNFRELQSKLDSAIVAGNRQKVNLELRRMALEELRNAKQLTQTDMAEILDVPQSSISRIEKRADMYLSTLREYINAVGGALQIQAVFPDGGTVVIDRFGDYDEHSYVLDALAEPAGTYRLRARPLNHQGAELSTKQLRLPGFKKVMRALRLSQAQITAITEGLEAVGTGEVQIGGGSSGIQRIFNAPILVAAGFERDQE